MNERRAADDTVAMYGISSAAGVKIAVDEINAAGGILGRPVKMITRDDKLNPEIGLREAKDLVATENVDFLTGTISSAVGIAVSNFAKREKKLFMSTISQSSSMTEENFHRYIVRTTTNTVPYFGYAPAIALAKTKRVKKVITLGFDYESGHNAMKMFKEKYLQLVPDAKVIDELWTPLEIARLGIGLVPEDRDIFPNLTVRENLEIAAKPPRNATRGGAWTIERVHDLFPVLRDRDRQWGGTLSGGEQQMLTLARTLMGNPIVLLLDEPSEGLAPKITQAIHAQVMALKKSGMTILLSEQNSSFALSVSDRAYILEKGHVLWQGAVSELHARPEILKAHLGV